MTQSPQEVIDEFWAKWDSKTPSRGQCFSRAPTSTKPNIIPNLVTTILPKNVCSKPVGEAATNGVVGDKNTFTSYEEAAKNCKAKIDKIVEECNRVNQKYRDPDFDIETDLRHGNTTASKS